MTIPTEYINNRAQHRYAGNGWAVVENLSDEWARIVYLGKGELANQIFLVWRNLLSVEKQYDKPEENMSIKPELLAKVEYVRDKIKSGKWIIKNTRLVKSA